MPDDRNAAMEKILVRHPAQRLYSILHAMYLLMKDFKGLNKQIRQNSSQRDTSLV